MNDSEPTGTNPHGGDRTGSHCDLSNMGDGALSRQTSKRDTPNMNTGYSTRNASRQYYTSLVLKFILNPFGIGSGFTNWA